METSLYVFEVSYNNYNWTQVGGKQLMDMLSPANVFVTLTFEPVTFSVSTCVTWAC